MGKEVVVGFATNVSKLLEENGPLNYKGTKLASKIKFEVGDWDTGKIEADKRIQEINRILKEFNAAMPYA